MSEELDVTLSSLPFCRSCHCVGSAEQLCKEESCNVSTHREGSQRQAASLPLIKRKEKHCCSAIHIWWTTQVFKKTLARFQWELQVWLKSLFPLYTRADVQCLPGCVVPLIRLEPQRHLSLKTLTIPQMQSYLCLLEWSIKVGFLRQLRVHNLLFPLLFKEGKYIVVCCFFVTSPFWKEDTGFVLASGKLPLPWAYSNTIWENIKENKCTDSTESALICSVCM